ncbi:MAG: glycerate kinase [Actinomycetota bacterium]|nr:glycerate kinase [Actinomycetota bacterium]
MASARALACPTSLKGTLSAVEAAAALRDGFERGGVDAEELPVADGGEGTAEVLQRTLGGEWREARVSDPLGRPVLARWLSLPLGTAVVESAEAIGLGRLAPGELDPLRTTSRGLGELVLAALDERPRSLLVCLGGTATVDGGAGLRQVLRRLPVPTRVACDVRNPLLGPRGAAHVYGPQKGASPEAVDELEGRLAGMAELRRYVDAPGAGAAGGLGAALAALGAELVPGADLVLEALGFRERLAAVTLAVTGEGTVDETSFEGKAPGAVVAACVAAGVRVALFGGRITMQRRGAELYELSGHRTAARDDLVRLGESLARTL